MADWNPQPGDIVCDCRFQHIRIKERNGDNLLLVDGSNCSLINCCDDPNHAFVHVEPVIGKHGEVYE